MVEAAREAARTRSRPILMTAVSTIVGILPLALGQGAGGESRAPLGTAVVGGMLFATLFTLFVVPAAYVLIDRIATAGFERARALRRGTPGRPGDPVLE